MLDLSKLELNNIELDIKLKNTLYSCMDNNQVMQYEPNTPILKKIAINNMINMWDYIKKTNIEAPCKIELKATDSIEFSINKYKDIYERKSFYDDELLKFINYKFNTFYNKFNNINNDPNFLRTSTKFGITPKTVIKMIGNDINIKYRGHSLVYYALLPHNKNYLTAQAHTLISLLQLGNSNSYVENFIHDTIQHGFNSKEYLPLLLFIATNTSNYDINSKDSDGNNIMESIILANYWNDYYDSDTITLFKNVLSYTDFNLSNDAVNDIKKTIYNYIDECKIVKPDKLNLFKKSMNDIIDFLNKNKANPQVTKMENYDLLESLKNKKDSKKLLDKDRQKLITDFKEKWKMLNSFHSLYPNNIEINDTIKNITDMSNNSNLSVLSLTYLNTQIEKVIDTQLDIIIEENASIISNSLSTLKKLTPLTNRNISKELKILIRNKK